MKNCLSRQGIPPQSRLAGLRKLIPHGGIKESSLFDDQREEFDDSSETKTIFRFIGAAALPMYRDKSPSGLKTLKF